MPHDTVSSPEPDTGQSVDGRETVLVVEEDPDLLAWIADGWVGACGPGG